MLLGVVHLVFTFRGTRFHPRDGALEARLKEVSPKISRQTTLWRAGIGFHASHSFGAMLFGLVYLHLAIEGSGFLWRSPVLLTIGLVYLAAMLVLARRYWFSVPFRGIAVATLLYAVALGTIWS